MARTLSRFAQKLLFKTALPLILPWQLTDSNTIYSTESIQDISDEERFGFSFDVVRGATVDGVYSKMVVGSPIADVAGNNSVGMKHDYNRDTPNSSTGTNWTYATGNLMGGGTAVSGGIGECVALSRDGEWRFTGQPGYDTPFGNTGLLLTQRRIGDVGFTVPDANPLGNKQFGSTMKTNFDGTTIIVGNDDGGSVDVYNRAGDIFTFKQTISAPGGNQNFGMFGASYRLSDDASVLVVGARGYTNGGFAGSGAVYTYRVDGGGNYIQKGARLSPPVNMTNLRFGQSISIDADGLVLAVGALGYTENGVVDTGQVYIYDWNEVGESWDIRQTISNPSSGGLGSADKFGWRAVLSASGEYMVISAPTTDLGSGAGGGRINIYGLNDLGDYARIKPIDSPNTTELSQFGYHCWMDDTQIVVGAPFDGSQGVPNQGAIHYFNDIG